MYEGLFGEMLRVSCWGKFSNVGGMGMKDGNVGCIVCCLVW